MPHGLLPFLAAIAHESVAVLKPEHFCNLPHLCNKVPQQLLVCIRLPNFIQGCDVPLRHNEHVLRRLRLRIAKRKDLFILVYPIGWNFPVYDFAKNAFHTG
jgi:hypothetical protein